MDVNGLQKVGIWTVIVKEVLDKVVHKSCLDRKVGGSENDIIGMAASPRLGDGH